MRKRKERRLVACRHIGGPEETGLYMLTKGARDDHGIHYPRGTLFHSNQRGVDHRKKRYMLVVIMSTGQLTRFQ